MADSVMTTTELTEAERQYILDLRASTLSMLDVYERRLGLSLTTADIRLWVNKRGPAEEIVIKQVRHIRECGG